MTLLTAMITLTILTIAMIFLLLFLIENCSSEWITKIVAHLCLTILLGSLTFFFYSFSRPYTTVKEPTTELTEVTLKSGKSTTSQLEVGQIVTGLELDRFNNDKVTIVTEKSSFSGVVGSSTTISTDKRYKITKMTTGQLTNGTYTEEGLLLDVMEVNN